MHVLFDARLLHRPLSGLERVQRNLIRELVGRAEIDRLQIVVVAGTKLPTDLPNDVEVVEVHTTEDILSVLLAENPADRPDVYHLTFFPDRSPRDLLLLPAAQASVVEIHDAILNRHPEYHPSRENWLWYDGFVKQLVVNADRLLVHSESVAKEVEEDLAGDPNKCDLAPLAVDPSLRDDVSEAFVENFKRHHGIEGSYFVALGKDYPHKDHATLFRAVARVSADVGVIIAGEKIWHGGRDTDELLARLGLTPRVRWMRGLSDEEVKALLQGSRGLVYPSLEEGFGLPPIEAMLRRVPVLAARSMSIPDVCGDGAWLFKPGDDAELAQLMDTVLRGGDEVDALTGRGLERAAGYSWARCADRVVECYASACTAAKARGATPQIGLAAILENITRYPYSEAQELTAWQDRCRLVEQHLRHVEDNRDGILAQLQDLQTKLGQPVTPQPEPVVVDDGPPRPRWSLRRRLRKIYDGLRRLLARSSARDSGANPGTRGRSERA